MGESNVAVVGAGPAGLMAAEVLAAQGRSVDVYDAMPSAGRKFLLAGRGGLPVEGFDPVEPIQNCACLFHDVERTRAERACLCSVCA